MNRSDLRHINLNLLLIFEALMHARSVSLAAERMYLGQPAVSLALGRLRTLFNDPLFQRVGRFMEPTPRAREIAQLLGPALESIAQAVQRPTGFDPASSDRVFRIGLSDDVEFALLPRLLRRIRAEAPGVALVVSRANYLLMPRLLASGEITVGVGYTIDLPAAAKRRNLRVTRTVLLRGDDAPGELDLEQFCARPHALVSFAGGTVGFVDDALRRLGRERKVVLAVPHFNSLGALLEGTDMLAAVPDYAAEVFTANGRLRAQPLPVALEDLAVHMVWTLDKDNDPAERWLRSRISMFLGNEGEGSTSF
ncbi:LysR family transcriptional regulator [Pseudomonas sp. NPDC090202]|uniref:LysR family transcriptional regulator n=1 Tax=unclassified Pseudomonas TaxID=196821 RepID=UPI0038189478